MRRKVDTGPQSDRSPLPNAIATTVDKFLRDRRRPSGSPGPALTLRGRPLQKILAVEATSSLDFHLQQKRSTDTCAVDTFELLGTTSLCVAVRTSQETVSHAIGDTYPCPRHRLMRSHGRLCGLQTALLLRLRCLVATPPCPFSFLEVQTNLRR